MFSFYVPVFQVNSGYASMALIPPPPERAEMVARVIFVYPGFVLDITYGNIKKLQD